MSLCDIDIDLDPGAASVIAFRLVVGVVVNA
jgi:hypothetical protein